MGEYKNTIRLNETQKAVGDFPQKPPHCSHSFSPINASSHETPFERNLNFWNLLLRTVSLTRNFTFCWLATGHVMICVDCFWQLSEQAIRLSWPRPWPEQTKLSCFYFQSTFAWPGLARMAISHGKFIACKFYKNLCQNSMHTKLSCNDNRISPWRELGQGIRNTYIPPPYFGPFRRLLIFPALTWM